MQFVAGKILPDSRDLPAGGLERLSPGSDSIHVPPYYHPVRPYLADDRTADRRDLPGDDAAQF